jgi:glycosyltransferase involved in cell wall biosynthesis
MSAGPARVAIVHDYFTQLGGAERVVAHLANAYPEASLRASVVDRRLLPGELVDRDVRPTVLQGLLRAGAPLASLGPLLPGAFGRMDLRGAEAIVTSTSAFAHHVRPPVGAIHVAYVHTPPRFLWHSETYFATQRTQASVLAPALAWLRRADRAAVRRIDVLVANSAWTARRLATIHGRAALVVHPPVDVDAFRPVRERNGRFLIVARLRPYKRLDVAIEAANKLRVPLDIIGSGPDLGRLRSLAGPTVRFHGRLSDAAVRGALARCAGLIVPGAEDFGLTMAEAQASGRPPIALAEGGACEIVEDGRTGFLVPESTADAFAAAMTRAVATDLSQAMLVAAARRFDSPRFADVIRTIVTAAIEGRQVVEWRPDSAEPGIAPAPVPGPW